MRWAIAALCVLGLSGAGCWGPKIASGGFACSPMDHPACPSGFYCVGGLCLDHPGPPGGVDGGAGGVGGVGGVGAADLSLPGGASDLGQPRPADLAMSPADLSEPPPPDMACFPAGHQCHGQKTCCDECCHGCTLFGYCALFELSPVDGGAPAPATGR